MKTIYVCFPDNNAPVIIVSAPPGTHIKEVAKLYPTANLYWIGAPLDTPQEDFSVIRYIPE